MLLGWKLLAAVALIFAALLAPLVIVLLVSVSPGDQIAMQGVDLSFKWYRTFFSKSTFYNSLFVVSLPLGLAVAAISTILGTAAAIALTRFKPPGHRAIEAILMMPLLIPSVLLGAALYLYFARLQLSGSIVALLVGHILIGLPYVVRVVSAGLAGVDPAIEEAAINLGCSRVGAYFKVVLPVIRGSLVSGFVFALIVSFSDINVALFLSGPNTQTLPLQIFSEIVWGGDPTIAAASGIQILLIGGLLIAIQKIFRVRLSVS